MRENAEQLRRPRGRPQIRCDAETKTLIVRAATEAFTAAGYAGTSMGEVAKAAGISTKTLYRLIPTKGELFKTVVADRIRQFMLKVDDAALAGLELEAALERILTAFGALTLNGETIALYRLVIGESDRFPEIATVFYETAIQRVSRVIEDWLRRQTALGLIAVDDPPIATGMLRGMMMMDVQRAVMMGQRKAPDAPEIAALAKACAHVFLDGCRVRQA